MKKLNTLSYRDRKERNPDRVAGTCEWFIHHHLFQDWKESSSPRLLWVSADPGCGKSVLVKYLVDEIILTTPKTTVCYFFFKDDFEDQKSINSALCCIMYQLFQQNPDLLTETMVNEIEAGGERFLASFNDLWHTILTAAQDVHAGEIICILDAIDECEDHGRLQLAKELCKLYDPESRLKLKLKFLVTSRPFGTIRRGFQPLQIPGMPTIHLSGESDEEMKKISAEIDIYIRARVEHIGERLKLNRNERNTLLEQLLRVSNRTYLWVYLTLDLIKSDINIDRAGILQATTHIPKTVDEAYDRILSKSYNPKEAARILHIIVAAERALSLRELGFALSIRGHPLSLNDVDIKSEDRLRENIRDTCGLFITIIHSRIYLLHQTAKEFLVRDSRLLSTDSVNPDLVWKHTLLPSESHELLAGICTSYLLLSRPDAVHNSNDHESQLTNNGILFDYSANYWATHVRKSQAKISEPMARSILRLCDINSKICKNWLQVFWKKTMNTTFPEGFTSLMVASYFGLYEMVKRMLSTMTNDIELNTQDRTYNRSALSWAAGNGFGDVVKLLVRGGRYPRRIISLLLFGNSHEINSLDAYGRTPLFYAIWKGNAAVVEILLRAKARLDLTDKIGGSPLFYAMSYRREFIVNLLYAYGATATSEDKKVNQLFFTAVKTGDEQFVQLFLDAGFGIESNSLNQNHREIKYEGDTPLHCAVRYGNINIVQLLLKYNADINSFDLNKRTPLSYAIEFKHIDIMHFLVNRGADINLIDAYTRMPLHFAIKSVNFGLIQFVIDTELNNNPVSKPKYMPILYAIESGNIDVIQFLIDRGADISSIDIKNRTPLSYAVQSRNLKLAHFLVDRGANIGLLDSHEQIWLGSGPMPQVSKRAFGSNGAANTCIKGKINYLHT